MKSHCQPLWVALFLVLAAGLSPGAGAEPSHVPSAAQRARWVKQLKHPTWQHRWRALVMLRNAGPKALHALSAISGCLTDSHPMVRAVAASTLAGFGAKAAPAIPALAKALDDANANVGMQAAIALGKIGDKAWKIVAQKAKGTRLELRKRLTVALPSFGAKAIPILLGYSKNPNRSLRVYALQALWKLSEHLERALLQLLGGIHDKASMVRYWTFQILSKMGPKARAAVPKLQALLVHAQENMRRNASRALGQIGAPARPALASMLAQFKREKSAAVRCEMLKSFGKIGAKASLPTLRKVLSQPKASLCELWRAIESVGRLKPIAASDVALLGGFLTRGQGDLRHAAAKAIGDAPPQARVAQWLLPRLVDPESRVILAAVQALGKMGPHATIALPAFEALLAMPRLSPQQKKQFPRLARLQNSYVIDHLQRTVLQSLRSMGPAAVPSLRKLLQHPSRSLAVSASQILCLLGAAAKAAVPELLKALTSPHPPLRFRAAEALGDIGHSSAKVLTGLQQALQDKHHWVRYYAVLSLGKLGARTSLPKLRKLRRDDPSPYVKQIAARAIRALEKARPTSRPAARSSIRAKTKAPISRPRRP